MADEGLWTMQTFLPGSFLPLHCLPSFRFLGHRAAPDGARRAGLFFLTALLRAGAFFRFLATFLLGAALRRGAGLFSS